MHDNQITWDNHYSLENSWILWNAGVYQPMDFSDARFKES
jgi:hypothetical protein